MNDTRPTGPRTAPRFDPSAPAQVLPGGELPNLDIAPLFGSNLAARDSVAKAIRAACDAPGFFYVHNSSVPDGVIEGALAAARRFFSLPDDEPAKQAVHNRHANHMKGWGPRFGEPAYQPGSVSYVESFDLDQPLSGPECQALGITPNLWPSLPGFREAVEAYYREATRLCRALAEVFSDMLGESPDFINRHSGPTAPRTLRLLDYPGGEAPADPSHVGISAHTDYECFTLMHQTAAGLELTDQHGRWRPAPAGIGTFTVILGDMLERLSNGRWRATGHRVGLTPWSRQSLILFFALDAGFEVTPLSQFVDAEHPPAYAPVTQGEHIARQLEAAGQPTAP